MEPWICSHPLYHLSFKPLTGIKFFAYCDSRHITKNACLLALQIISAGTTQSSGGTNLAGLIQPFHQVGIGLWLRWHSQLAKASLLKAEMLPISGLQWLLDNHIFQVIFALEPRLTFTFLAKI